MSSVLQTIFTDARFIVDQRMTLNDQIKSLLATKGTDQIASIFETIYIEAENVSKSIADNPKVVGETLVAISLGLSSNDSTVCLWTCRILSRLAYHLRNMVEKAVWKGIYTSFKSPGGIFDMCLACLKKHPLERSVFAVIEHFIHSDIPDFFVFHLGTNIISNTQIIHRLFEYSERNALTRYVLESNNNVVGQMLNILLQTHESAGGEQKLAIIQFICYIYCTYYKNCRDSSDSVLLIMKRGSQNSSLPFRLVCLSCLFEILHLYLHTQEDKKALEVFRFLAFMILEYHGDPVKSFLICNMISQLESHSKLPANIMIDSFIKFLVITPYDNFDMDFLVTLAKHATVDGYFAERLLEFLWTIAVNDALFGKVAMLSILVLTNRFPDLAEEIIMKNMRQSVDDLRTDTDSTEHQVRSSLILTLFSAIVDLMFVNINDSLITLIEKEKADDPNQHIMKLWMYLRKRLSSEEEAITVTT